MVKSLKPTFPDEQKQWVATALCVFFVYQCLKPAFWSKHSCCVSSAHTTQGISAYLLFVKKCSTSDITCFAFVVVFNSQENTNSPFIFFLHHATNKNHKLRCWRSICEFIKLKSITAQLWLLFNFSGHLFFYIIHHETNCSLNCVVFLSLSFPTTIRTTARELGLQESLQYCRPFSVWQ